MSENTRSAGVESYSLSAANGGVEETAESKIIRTVSLSLGSGTFDQDLETLQTLCTDAGGWVSYSSVSGDAAQSSRRASLTLRIPQEQLETFLQGAGSLGRVISQTETAQDVTASYQDIAARLATQQAKMERLQALMSETATLSERWSWKAPLPTPSIPWTACKASLTRPTTRWPMPRWTFPCGRNPAPTP